MVLSRPTLDSDTLPFALDLSASGMCFRLTGRGTGLLRVPELTLEAPIQLRAADLGRATDFARQLRNRLSAVSVEIDEGELSRVLRPLGIVVRLRADGVRLTWSVAGVRVTARARLFPDEESLLTGPALALSVDDVRVHGFLPTPWPQLVGALLDRLPEWLAPRADRVGGTVATIDVVRGALRGVLPPAGWKLPDSSGATVLELIHGDGHVSVTLGTQRVGRPMLQAASAGRSLHRAFARLLLKRAHADLEAAVAGGDNARAIATLRRRLESGGEDEPYVEGRFLQVALAEPVLHAQCAAVARARLARDSDDTLAHCALVVVGQRAGDAVLASAAAAQLVHIAEEAGEPFELIAAAIALARVGGPGRASHAADALGRAAARCPDEPALLRDLATAATVAGATALARELRQRLLLADLSDADAATVASELARDALADGAHADARLYVDFARTRAQHDVAVLELAAEVAGRVGDTAGRREALEHLTSAQVSGSQPRVTARAYHALALMAPPAEAVALSRMAHALAPDESEYSVALAEAHERVGDVSGAFALWTSLSGSGDPVVEARAAVHLAALAAASPALRGVARARITRVLAQSPTHAEALDALALVADDDASWEQVLTAYERAARATAGHQESARFELMIGLLREDRLGLLHDAVDAYERTIAVDQTGTYSAPAVERLARLLEQLGRWESLADLLRHAAVTAHTDSARTAARLRLAALCAGPLGSPGEAVMVLRELLDERPRDLPTLRATAALLRGVDVGADADLRLRALLRLATLAPVAEREAAAIEAAELLATLDRHGEADAVLERAGAERPRVRAAAQRLAAARVPSAPVDPREAERAASDAADAGQLELALSLLAPHVLCERPDPGATALLRELLSATGRTDELAAVEAHLRASAG